MHGRQTTARLYETEPSRFRLTPSRAGRRGGPSGREVLYFRIGSDLSNLGWFSVRKVVPLDVCDGRNNPVYWPLLGARLPIGRRRSRFFGLALKTRQETRQGLEKDGERDGGYEVGLAQPDRRQPQEVP